ncbi:MAG: peptide ABC transporter substrate-binding protein [Chitinophagales bacterium]|nr:MAG: peptide ABC transporter substrate-binding protein [Chitinophagales bacterium]
MYLGRFFFFSAVTLSILSGCGTRQGDKALKVFRYNSSSGITSLDPAFARDQANIWAVNQIYSGLLRFDAHLRIQPDLARSWTISDDGLTYTFYLRQDVFFHDHPLFQGKKRKMIADDVVYTLHRLVDPVTASPGSWIFHDRVDTLSPFTAVNDSTVVIRLKKPFRPLLSILTMQYTFVVPREIVEHFGKDFRMHPVGTGPFRFKVWQEGNVLILTKNEHYYEEGLPYLDGVKVSFIQSKQTEYLHFMQGELDFLSGVDASYINDLLTPEGQLRPELSATLKMYKTPYLNTEYLGILMQDPESGLLNPLSIREVRQAIGYGFDRAAIIRYLRNNIGRPATAGIVPYGLPSFSEEKVQGYTFQPQTAAALLAKAGFPGGKGLPVLSLYTSKSYEDIATFIQKQLEELGIRLKLEIVLPAFQRELMARGQAPFFRGSWIADYPDAESYLAMFYSGHGAPPNYTRFRNAQFDSLYVRALNENEDSLRFELYRQMDNLLMQEAVVIPLYYDEVVRFVHQNIHGMEPNPMNLLDLRKVKKD